LEDIAEANELMKNILLKKSDELGYATRKYFEQLKHHLQDNNQKTFVNSSIRKIFREHPSKQKRFMIELQQYGFIRKVDGDKKKGFVYEVVSTQEYSKLQHIINTALDDVLQRLQGVSGSEVVHGHSKPLKAATVKRKAEVVQ
jgi:hypothetical protein